MSRKTHGERSANAGKRTKELEAWMGMKRRCYNKNNPDYKNYGGRGIAVCGRWIKSYEVFLSDIGRAPTPLHSIERINNGKNYSPGNCRWATPAEQRRNQRRTKLTEKDVNEILSRYTGAWGQQTSLGKEFGVRQNTISDIVLHKKWRI